MDAGILLSESMNGEAAAILADPTLSPDTRRCLARFFAWGAAPTVDAYCDLFRPDGTLLDADMDQPISGGAIGESIARVLQLLPDFRFAPRRVLAEGSHVFVLAANRASLGERALAWDAIYALTLGGDRIAAGRRYYDQAALLTGVETFGSGTAARRPGPGPAEDASPRPLDLPARTDAWNRRDFHALYTALVPDRVHLAGVARTLAARDEVTAALAVFAARSEGLRLDPGAVARTPDGTAIEWVGTIGRGGATRRFALVELCTALPKPREWHVVFNTAGL